MTFEKVRDQLSTQRDKYLDLAEENKRLRRFAEILQEYLMEADSKALIQVTMRLADDM